MHHASPSSSAAARPGTEEFPVDIVSDEEMALIDAALAAAAAGARPLLSAAARRAAAPLSCAAYPPAAGDIEDTPLPRRSRLARFRERRALAVTDITATVTPLPKARAFRISLSKLAPFAFRCLVFWADQMCSCRVILLVTVLLAAGMVREADGVRARTGQAGKDRGHEGRFGPPCPARARGEPTFLVLPSGMPCLFHHDFTMKISPNESHFDLFSFGPGC